MAGRLDYVTCLNCGEKVPIPNTGKVLGRKPLNIDVKNILDALRTYRDIALAARSLDCSRGHIYGELKKHGMTPKEVIQGK
jgi:hypothetical protein